jgi:hypothetical protein
MAVPPDYDPPAGSGDVIRPGPMGFRRVFSALAGAFGFGSDKLIQSPQGLGGSAPPVPVEIVARAKAQAQSTNAALFSRMELSRRKLMVWQQCFRGLVEEKLRESLHPENYRRMYFTVHVASNPLRRVVGELAILYENPAKREIEDASAVQTEGAGTIEGEVTGRDPAAIEADAESSFDDAQLSADLEELADLLDLSEEGDPEEPDDSPWERLQRAWDWDVLLSKVEQLTCFLPAVWVRPIVTGPLNDAGEVLLDRAELSYIIYTPASADVVTDPSNPTKAIAFWYFAEEVEAGTGRLIRVIWLWTEDLVWKLDAQWHPIKSDVNPLGRLPITVFRRDLPEDGYYCDGQGDDLYEGTLELCVLRTIQNARARDAGFKQLAIEGDAKDLPADQVMGGPAPIILGPEAKAVVLDLQPNLKDWTELCRDRATELATRYGLAPGEYFGEKLPQSGYAKKLDREKVLRQSRAARKHFQRSEQDLYHLTACVLQDMPLPSIGKLSEAATLVTDFGEPNFDLEPKEQGEVDAIRLKYGIVSIIDILQRENPDLSRRELAEMALKNRRINSILMTPEEIRLTDLLAEGMVGIKQAVATDPNATDKQSAQQQDAGALGVGGGGKAAPAKAPPKGGK